MASSAGAPTAAANSLKSPAQALSSLAPLLQWTIATGSPAGVVTRSSSRCTCDSGPSSTTIAKIEVPALTLPVRGTIPVPASPSGGQTGAPACSRPLGSSSAAPSGVSDPAASPAEATRGSTCSSGVVKPSSPRRRCVVARRAAS